MGDLTTFAKGDVLLKKPLRKPTDFDVGEFSKAIAADSGAMVKVSPLDDFLKLMKNEKWDKPVVHLGIDKKKNLVITGQSANGHQGSVIVVKNYVKLKADRADIAVVNADKGDRIIDQATKDMSNAKKVTAQDKRTAKLDDVKGDIIILAHGGSKGSTPGKIYASSFADKKPAAIVTYLTKTKKLPTTYAGTIYLDGCFTAAGPSKGTSMDDLNNFAGTVYNGLKKKGYTKLQVKGNLGVASTSADGVEGVRDAQMQAEFKKRMKPFIAKMKKAQATYEKVNPAWPKAAKERKALQKQVTAATEARDGEQNAAAKKKLTAALKKLETKLAKAETTYQTAKRKVDAANETLQSVRDEYLEERQKLQDEHRISDEIIEDLVGTFGPEQL